MVFPKNLIRSRIVGEDSSKYDIPERPRIGIAYMAYIPVANTTGWPVLPNFNRGLRSFLRSSGTELSRENKYTNKGEQAPGGSLLPWGPGRQEPIISDQKGFPYNPFVFQCEPSIFRM